MDKDIYHLNDDTNNTENMTIGGETSNMATEQNTNSIEQEFYQSASQAQEEENAQASQTQKASVSGSYSAEPAWQPGTFYEQPKKKKKEKKPVTMGRVVGVGMAFMVATVAINTAVTYVALKENIGGYVSEENYNKGNSILSTQSNINEKLENSGSVTTTGGTAGGELSISDIADAVLPSVVSITSTTIYQSSSNPFMFGGSYQVQGAGSGIIIGTNDEELLIVTNNHVVEDTTSLTIEFVDGSTVDSAYVKGTKSSNDLAVVGIKLDDISEETSKQIRIATLGDSDTLEVGNQVVAIGNALGYGQSLTVGYVSALNRTLTVDDSEMQAIQTDASINGGNSGGALINMKGEVIGINFAKQSSSGSSSASVEGMGYAIPISQAKEIIDELVNREVRDEVDEDKKGYIGITNALSIDASTSEMYGIPKGAYLKGIAENSPAEKAGIQIGDVVVAVDGQEIDSYDELQEQMGYYEAGETITLTIKRVSGSKYKEQKIEVTLCSYEELLDLIEE